MAKMYDSTPGIAFTEKAAEYEQTVRANEMNPIVAVYLNILNLGNHAVSDKKTQRYIQSTNFIAFNSFIASLVYLMLAIFWENTLYLNATLLMASVSLITLFLNGYGAINLSRLTYTFFMNFTVFASAVIAGPDSHSENFLVIAIIIPCLIYDIKKPALPIAFIVLSLVLVFVYINLGYRYANYYVTADQQNILKNINIVVQIGLVLSAIYQVLALNRQTEDDLESSNAQMLMQTAELKRSNSDLEQFAYIISHDLKTPVRNISSFMNLLVHKHGGSMSSEALEFVNYSHRGAKRLERLIDDVLAYCRIGTNLPKPVPVNLNEVTQTIRFELKDRLTNMNGEIHINKELPTISHVHSSLMYHVFQNLINNGLKFNKSHKPEININWTNSLNHYTFSISDNGIGISKEYSAIIFQMFKRLHNETDYDGTGIGLAICKKIVEYYNGEIWFESEEGKGTTFFFTIRKF